MKKKRKTKEVDESKEDGMKKEKERKKAGTKKRKGTKEETFYTITLPYKNPPHQKKNSKFLSKLNFAVNAINKNYPSSKYNENHK